MESLYLIKCNNEFFKIGIANDLQSRLASLQTGNPYPLIVEFCFEFQSAAVVEKALHQKFAHCRSRGEWFKFLTADMADFVALCRMLGGIEKVTSGDIATEAEIEEAEEVQKVVLDDGEHYTFNCDRDGNHYVYTYGGAAKEPNGRSRRVYKWVFNDPRTQEFCSSEATRWLANHVCNKKG